METTSARQERWRKEAEFFDEWARRALAELKPADPMVLDRYGRLRRRRFSKEFRFRIMGDLRGKRVLDVGCGDGLNAINFAKLGAHVTGVDISPEAIYVARERARVNGVESAVELVCSPMEAASIPDSSFDIVWADAFLHHVIPELESVMAQLCRYARPDGLVVLIEPINLSPLLRRIRFMLPISSEASPDERPLEPAEIAIVKAHFTELRTRHFGLDRFMRFVIDPGDYEGAPAWRKACVNLLCAIDWAVFSLPFTSRLASSCVFWGRPRKA